MSEERENIPQPKETSQGLPVVTSATIGAIRENYTVREGWGDHLEEVKTRLVDENPHLARFIESQVAKYPLHMHNPLFELVVATVAVLEHQASANKFEDRFGNDSEED